MATKTTTPEARAESLQAAFRQRYPALSVSAYVLGEKIALDASSELGGFVEYVDPAASVEGVILELRSYFMDLEYDTVQARARRAASAAADECTCGVAWGLAEGPCVCEPRPTQD